MPDEPTPPPEAPVRDRRRIAAAVGGGLLVAAVIAMLIVGLVNRDVESGIRDALASGERPEAPELTLPVLVAGDGVGPEGRELALSDLRGRAVVLNFWASWCDPCRDEAPVLQRLADRYPPDEVLVLGLDTQDLSENARGFYRELGIDYPSLRDGTDGAERAFQLTGVPETFVIDPDGRIAYHHIGVVRDIEQLVRPLETL